MVVPGSEGQMTWPTSNMPTSERERLANTVGNYLIVALLIASALAVIVFAITKDNVLSLRLFLTALLLSQVTQSVLTFYTGRLRLFRRLTITRAASPRQFYFLAILTTATSLGFLTLLVLLAFVAPSPLPLTIR
jgi:hypothetical protein